jgi:hypothetical protein
MQRRREGIVALAVAVSCVFTTSARLAAQGDSEPCCAITGIDAARGAVTVKDKSGRFTFTLTLANQLAVADLRVGRAVGFSNASKTLFLSAVRGQSAQQLPLRQIQFAGFSSGGVQIGAVGSGASSGGFQNPPDGKCGKVGEIKETPTQQCVVTQSSGPGCLFCVPIKK